MKITSVEAIPFRAPRKKPWNAAFGQVVESEYAVVFVHTDAGLTGVGEIATVWDRKGIAQAADVNRVLAPLLIGRDPLRLNELCTLIRGALGRDGNPAKAGVDIALHDLVGKALNVPVHQLLGGRLRERCGLSVSLNMAPPEEMAAEAVDYLAQGFRTLKLKAGLDQRHDLAALEAIRSRIGPDVPLRVDINAGWSMAKEGVRWVRQFERFGLEFVEQPARAHDVEGLAFIRERSPIPIMADESVWTATDALAVIRRGAADLINIYVMEAGGLREAKLAAGVCEAAGMPVMLGSMPEFGIGTAAQVHLGVTLPNLIEANDLCGFLYHREDIIEPTLVVENGTIMPPSGPGLGVTVARERLERWRVG